MAKAKPASPQKTTATAKKAAAKKAAPEKTAGAKASAAEVDQFRGLSIVAYLGILFIIPLLTGDSKKSAYLRFHINQGIVLCIFSVAVWIAVSILGAIFGAIIGISMSSPFAFYRFGVIGLIGAVLMPLIWLAILILAIIGIVNAATGKMNPLPVIGKITIIK